MEKKENKKNVKTIEVSKEEQNKFLEDLVFKGTTTYTKKILRDSIEVTFKSLSGSDQMEIEDRMLNVKGNATKLMHAYTIWLLSYSLQKFGDLDLSEAPVEKKFEFISKKSSAVIDNLAKIHNEFHDKINACLKGEKIEETFFEIPSTSLD